MQAKHRIAVCLVAVLLSFIPFAGATAVDFFDLVNLSESSKSYYTMKDRRDHSVILRTARILHPGDRYIDQDNRCFCVVKIDRETAWAEQIEQRYSFSNSFPETFFSAGKITARNSQGRKPRVGVYHTHGAESYVPSDGTATMERGGGILQVGDSFARALQKKGFTVNHIRETHTPHDAGAYQRSRRTAEELIVEGDQLIFDVHRDAVPPEEYEETVEGEKITRILLVVGQQNQNADNNRSFAITLKQIADEKHPGLIKGILGAQGNYNQDLTPQAVLLEVGAHKNSREDAEKAVNLFADVVEQYVIGAETAIPGQDSRANRLSLSSVFKVVVLLAAALFLYLLITTRSKEEMKQKITAFFGREFADLRGPGRPDDRQRKRN